MEITVRNIIRTTLNILNHPIFFYVCALVGAIWVAFVIYLGSKLGSENEIELGEGRSKMSVSQKIISSIAVILVGLGLIEDDFLINHRNSHKKCSIR